MKNNVKRPAPIIEELLEAIRTRSTPSSTICPAEKFEGSWSRPPLKPSSLALRSDRRRRAGSGETVRW
ncbi:hypothetical protein M8494_25620 [Serratia ureilytica]